ncbi:RNase J family beta-CASP ribonuclease [Candidatus Gracilibacteria bacterium]|nr:RNase J family beta-CASP ribonuclease [Candidatus Gracilibacteria bacterium]
MKDFFDELDKELTGEEGTEEIQEEIEEEIQNNVEAKKSEVEEKKEIEIALQENREYRPRTISNFPETKFYLPTLREGYTRVIPIGGNNETGSKNMNLFQYGDDLVIVDCGVQFAEPDMLGANYSIPDISSLIQYKDKIKGILITHAHLDHIGALKHILPPLGMPTIFATKLTIGIIKKGLEEARLLSYATFVEVSGDSTEKVKIGNHFTAEFFRVNHSIPDCVGILLETPGGARIVHTGDFKIDFTPAIDKPADLSRIGEIGRRGITLLLSDSTGSIRKGFSKSEKDIGESLEKIIANHTKGRLIIATFSSWISRVQQLINICDKHGKQIFVSGRSMVENIAIAKELGYLKMKPGAIKKMSPKVIEEVALHNQVIVTTGSQGEEFSALTRMSEGKHNSLEIIKGDTIIFSSSVVPGNERSVYGVINKLLALGANVITKDDQDVHTGGHAFQEEQKIMLNLVNPKYFLPVYGDLYFRSLHKNTAVSIGFPEENVLLQENGSIIDLAPNQTVFKSRIKMPIQDIIIDGNGIGTANSHVIKAREKMMDSGVLVIIYKVDTKTKEIIGNIKIESRGLVYLDEVKLVHKMVFKKAKDVYENTVGDVPDIEEKDLVKIIKTDLEALLLQKIERQPMIIPIILYV